MGLVIGLHGAKGSGKDQFYKAVKDAFPSLDVRKIAYADPIKEEVCRIFDLQNEEEYDNFKRTHLSFAFPSEVIRSMSLREVSGRQVVREIGMMMRRYNEQQFVEYVERKISNAPEAIWCITDLRFVNELGSIRKLNGLVVKIKRSGVQYDGHVTETEFPDILCDSIINNIDLTLDEYNKVAVKEFEYLMRDKR